jgi:hypothetical protein
MCCMSCLSVYFVGENYISPKNKKMLATSTFDHEEHVAFTRAGRPSARAARSRVRLGELI